MRTVHSAWLGLSLVACAAPPPIEVGTAGTDPVVEPSIEMLFPGPDTIQIALDENCHFRTLVVVDLDGVDFVEPGAATEDVDGEGHWHVYLDPYGSYAAPDDQYYDLDLFEASNPATFKDLVDTTMRLWVQIQTNLHEPVDCPACEDAIEFTLEDPTDCVPPAATTGS